MPRQVYGKKARAVYDPFAAFGSPHSSSPDNEIRTPSHRFKERAICAGTKVKGDTAKRRALEEKDANTVAQPALAPQKVGEEQKRGQTKKIVTGDSDDDQELENVDGVASAESREAELKEPIERIRSVASMHAETCPDVDDVPLFVDGHGYESTDDEDEISDAGDNLDPILAVEQDTSTAGGIHPSTPSITVLPATPPATDGYSEHCASLLQHSHHSMTDFSKWSDQLSSHFNITKIAEASFGEVYRLSLLEQLAGFSSNDESVFKVIALKPPISILPLDKRKQDAARKKAELMSHPEDVANEVRLLQRMSIIPGFTNFRDVRVVKGRPPAPFAKAFKAYNASQKARKKEASHFPDPAKKGSYADDQLWAVIEMQDAGTDLECLGEHGECSSMWFAWDVFWQVVLSLAKGEEGAEFEHRDLHLGNICVRQSTDFNEASIDTKRKLNFTGIETTIIDYTISRALMQDSSIAYQDLARDSGLFEGDSTEEYQYDIYRYMRGAVLANNAYAEPPFPPPGVDSPRPWEDYHAITNLMWLHFVLYKLLEQTVWPSALKPPPRKQKDAHARWKRANDLEHVLLRVQELLDPGVVCEEEGGLKSASQLVGLALEEGWLDVGDVVGEEVVDAKVEGKEGERRLVEDIAQLDLKLDSTDELAEGGTTVEPQRQRPRTRRKR